MRVESGIWRGRQNTDRAVLDECPPRRWVRRKIAGDAEGQQLIGGYRASAAGLHRLVGVKDIEHRADFALLLHGAAGRHIPLEGRRDVDEALPAGGVGEAEIVLHLLAGLFGLCRSHASPRQCRNRSGQQNHRDQPARVQNSIAQHFVLLPQIRSRNCLKPCGSAGHVYRSVVENLRRQIWRRHEPAALLSGIEAWLDNATKGF